MSGCSIEDMDRTGFVFKVDATDKIIGQQSWDRHKKNSRPSVGAGTRGQGSRKDFWQGSLIFLLRVLCASVEAYASHARLTGAAVCR